MKVLKWFLAAAVVVGTTTAANAQLLIDAGDVDVMVDPTPEVQTVPLGTTIELPAVTTDTIITQPAVTSVGCPTACPSVVSTPVVTCPTAMVTDACGNVITQSAVIEEDDDHFGLLDMINPFAWLDAIFD